MVEFHMGWWYLNQQQDLSVTNLSVPLTEVNEMITVYSFYSTEVRFKDLIGWVRGY